MVAQKRLNQMTYDELLKAILELRQGSKAQGGR